MCVGVCASLCVSVQFGQWGDAGVCPGGLKGMQVAWSAICRATVLGWYLTTCSVEFKMHKHTHTHPPTRTHTRPHTDVHKHTHRSLEGRDEISSSSVLHWDLETQTWRPWPYIWPHDPGVQMHSRPPTHTQKCTPAHTCTLFFMTFLPKSKAMLCLMCHKCAYLNICALRKSQSSFFISNHLILGLHATLIIDAIKSWHVGTCLWVYGCVPPQCHHINQIRSTVSK